jgi:hypothetical protein
MEIRALTMVAVSTKRRMTRSTPSTSLSTQLGKLQILRFGLSTAMQSSELTNADLVRVQEYLTLGHVAVKKDSVML